MSDGMQRDEATAGLAEIRATQERLIRRVAVPAGWSWAADGCRSEEHVLALQQLVRTSGRSILTR